MVPRKRLSGAARRETLLDAAAELIVTQGFDALTMERVAERVHVNKAMVYRYYANRDDLLVAVFDRANTRLDAVLQDSLRDAVTFEQKVHTIVSTYLDALDRNDLTITHMQGRNVGGPVVKSYQDRRLVAVLQFITELVTTHFNVEPARALTAAVVFSAGLSGLVEFGAVTGAHRRQLENDYVAMVAGAIAALRPTQPSTAPTPTDT